MNKRWDFTFTINQNSKRIAGTMAGKLEKMILLKTTAASSKRTENPTFLLGE